MAYQGAGIGAIETEDLDRRLGVHGLCVCESADRSVGDARRCHAGASHCESRGEHGVGDAEGMAEWRGAVVLQWLLKLLPQIAGRRMIPPSALSRELGQNLMPQAVRQNTERTDRWSGTSDLTFSLHLHICVVTT